MKKSTAIRDLAGAALIATAVVLGAGCAGPTPTPPAVPGAASQFTTAEREFVLQAAANGVYEVQAAQLALGRATDPRVKAFADRLVTQHLQANGELNMLLRAKAMVVPPELPPDRVAKLQELAAFPAGAAFDHGFLRVVGVQDHLADIAAFERASGDAADPDLRAWIVRTLPTLRAHLSQAQSLAAAIGA